ncbi:MAG: tRNA (adenosine(37)-N6)-dimethylallyltransferase MiaA, partial [Proteobacteria bacterium]|nr:tRNA (adenosine(37)-N6)-dimethylallyltransferase MiaA [Pseudomonadota bacterium]
PTASGKTALSVQLAGQIMGEIISADSRQVFKKMDLGTGKDLDEYKNIPHHLIDILDAGTEFSVADFQNRAHQALKEIIAKEKIPIICGGTGYYIKALIEDYQFEAPSSNMETTRLLEKKDRSQLYEKLLEKGIADQRDWKKDSKRRIVRAIEKANTQVKNVRTFDFKTKYSFRIYYTDMDTDSLRKRIKIRLDERIDEGMINEVRTLLDDNIGKKRIERYGLEYKWISLYLHEEIQFKMMKEKLFTEICRFAKRQKTFIRYLQKQGHSMTPVKDASRFLEDSTQWLKSKQN